MTTVATLTAKPLDRLTAARGISAAVRQAINEQLPEDAYILDEYANRLDLCNDPGNVWIGEDLHSEETGELFNANGKYWQCSLKLCPACLAKQSYRNRKRLRTAIEAQKLFLGEDLYFITLTTPNPNLSLFKTRNILEYAWTLFRKRKYVKNLFVGYAKSEEFTVTGNGINYHFHLIVRSRFIKYQYIRQIWTECLTMAFMANAQPFFVKTKDASVWCVIKKITSVTNAVNEVAKYITKSDSWSKIPYADLLEIIRIERFPRMFELGGSFRISPIVDDAPDTEPNLEDAILDTGYLSDAKPEKPSTSWREYLIQHGTKAYKIALQTQIEACREARKRQLADRYPYATFKTLHDLEPITRGKVPARADCT